MKLWNSLRNAFYSFGAICVALIIGCTDPDPGGAVDCGGFAGTQCSAVQVCIYTPNNCQIADNIGTCVDRPEFCTEQYDPVCGCNGATYGNECEATAAGVSIDHSGECEVAPQVCGGIAGISCANATDVCIFAENTCAVADNQGECVTLPIACTAHYDPVCGCDGNTYGNACEATAAGMSVSHQGQCI